MNYVTSHTFTHINANHTIRAEFESIWNKKKMDRYDPSILSLRIPAVIPARH